MFRRLCAILLIVSFCLPVQADTRAGLRAAVQDYLYVMEVEGAALDPAAAERARAQLEKTMNELLADGASVSELLGETIALIPDEQLRRELDGTFRAMNASRLDEATAVAMMLEQLSSVGATGAAWTPQNTVMVGLTLAAIIFMVSMVGKAFDRCNYDGVEC